eukprot:Phypoly_transcript_12179.p1 GENE.Phypoly_transcript_12179~~Phypoly_transcript_12179.p1  ORF type:complete len:345 (+),score=49.53 Phypoly_transcript_12179:79-1113(+)
MCTDLLLAVPENKVVVAARSMEFSTNLNCKIRFRKAGEGFQGVGGRHWHTHHNYVSIDAVMVRPVDGKATELEGAVDGMNDKGLSVGSLWFANYAKFESAPSAETVHVTQFVDYLLGTYTLVQDVLNDVNDKKLKIWASDADTTMFPLHYPIHDATGVSGIIEFTKDQTIARINHTHTCTNSPGIDWHLNNLGYYSTLAAVAPPLKVGDVTLSAGGAGLRGIPGDSYPASRFVRAFYTAKFAVESHPPKTAKDAVILAGHLMNAVDIAIGESQGIKHDNEDASFVYTQWIVVKDLVNRKLFYRTYNSFGFGEIDLLNTDFSSASFPLVDIPTVLAHTHHHHHHN